MDELSGGGEAEPVHMPVSVLNMFNDVRMRLVETGTRNRLVHVNRASARGNVLNIVNERSDEVYKLLCVGKTMRFKALGRDKVEDTDELDLSAGSEDPDGEDRYTDNFLETRLGPDALQKKLLKLHREAQTAEEESGVNILYLALGFLTWFEDESSTIAREAPLVLLPAELVRNARTSTFDVRLREEDLPTNLPLQQRLKSDFGITLPEIEPEDGWLPSHYFDKIHLAIEERPRWKIEPDGIQLGFFSFSKLLMYRDLDVKSWPQGTLTEHELTRGLLYEGFDTEPPLFGPSDRLDEVLPPEKLFHVVDADASQARVIEEVRIGRNLVVQGPPGTGKSQTITNIIAAAVREGKRVLFLAEKMAALSVVHDRLVKVGLRDVCLELHSRSANKKSVLAELARTLKSGLAVPSVPVPPDALKEARDRLNTFADELHRPIGQSGETGYSVLGRQARFLGGGAPPPRLDGSKLTDLSREQEAALAASLHAYCELMDELGEEPSPFVGVENLDIQPVELTRLRSHLQATARGLSELHRFVTDVEERLGLELPAGFDGLTALRDLLGRLEDLPAGASPAALSILSSDDLPRLEKDLESGVQWRAARDENAPTFIDEAFDTPVVGLRGALAAGTDSFFARWGRPYRTASRQLAGLLRDRLPKQPHERIDLVDTLLDVSARKKSWNEDETFLAGSLAALWQGERTDFPYLATIAQWCVRLSVASLRFDREAALQLAADSNGLATIRTQLQELADKARTLANDAFSRLQLNPSAFAAADIGAVPLRPMADRFSLMSASIDEYGQWAKIARLKRELTRNNLADLVARVDDRELNGNAAVTEFRFARAEALWREAIAQSEPLRALALEQRHALVSSFAELERQRLKDNVTSILARHLAQVPQGAMGEMRVIRGEIGKKRGHIALRRLFERAGSAIQRIKPVLLMSPISVAQFIPPGTLTFDLLVIDEASQVRPEDALGAIARARQIVVVGDKKQLPPSSFFDRLISEDDEAQFSDEAVDQDLLGGAAKLGELESVLTLCEARGLSSRMLSWHYRSRDPSLIEVSNREFYENGLILPPSPLQHDPGFGLCLTRVDGVYD